MRNTNMIVYVGGMVPGAAAVGRSLAAGVWHQQARVVLVPRTVAPVRVANCAATLELRTHKHIIYLTYYNRNHSILLSSA